jgi:hypothetical protein
MGPLVSITRLKEPYTVVEVCTSLTRAPAISRVHAVVVTWVGKPAVLMVVTSTALAPFHVFFQKGSPFFLDPQCVDDGYGGVVGDAVLLISTVQIKPTHAKITLQYTTPGFRAIGTLDLPQTLLLVSLGT